MGYAIVTAFEDILYKKVRNAIGNSYANKIPFGRDCDRDKANQVLDYHVTLVNWKESQNAIYLPRTDVLHFQPCELIITGSRIKTTKDGGYLLRFDIVPGNGFSKMKSYLEKCMELPISQSLHITLAVDDDSESLRALQKKIDSRFEYPCRIKVTGWDMYHLWRPVKLTRRIR